MEKYNPELPPKAAARGEQAKRMRSRNGGTSRSLKGFPPNAETAKVTPVKKQNLKETTIYGL
jgi:hypothetical protein